MLTGGAAAALASEELLWVPGRKVISIPSKIQFHCSQPILLCGHPALREFIKLEALKMLRSRLRYWETERLETRFAGPYEAHCARPGQNILSFPTKVRQ